eukprot:SAG31_NODE_7240_length_1745_cov_2.156136_1_plen_117_part_00
MPRKLKQLNVHKEVQGEAAAAAAAAADGGGLQRDQTRTGKTTKKKKKGGNKRLSTEVGAKLAQGTGRRARLAMAAAVEERRAAIDSCKATTEPAEIVQHFAHPDPRVRIAALEGAF